MDHETMIAKLDRTLSAFDEFDLLKRQGVNRVPDIFNPSEVSDKTQTIFRDHIDYVGNAIQLIVFRNKKASGDARDKTQFALFNDITGHMQPISVQQVYRVYSFPPHGRKLETDLEVLDRKLDHALQRIEVKLNQRK